MALSMYEYDYLEYTMGSYHRHLLIFQPILVDIKAPS